ncbi:MAG: hypothetical protein KY445_15155, partial [Armatimonadetes bacterium]|nr:hypothetical protein [Armatimonadota bacterium]
MAVFARYPPVLAARLAVFLPLLLLCGGVRAQNSEAEWQAGEKALRARRFDAALAHFSRVVTALQNPKVPMDPKFWPKPSLCAPMPIMAP